MSKQLHRGANHLIFHKARELRNNLTSAEEVLWGYLKTKPLGYKFRRQHPYSLYILDFYSHALKLVIEVDGSIHNIESVKLNDIERQKFLEQDGLKVIRFTNEEVLNKLELVMKRIEAFIIQNKNIDEQE